MTTKNTKNTVKSKKPSKDKLFGIRQVVLEHITDGRTGVKEVCDLFTHRDPNAELASASAEVQEAVRAFIEHDKLENETNYPLILDDLGLHCSTVLELAAQTASVKTEISFSASDFTVSFVNSSYWEIAFRRPYTNVSVAFGYDIGGIIDTPNAETQYMVAVVYEPKLGDYKVINKSTKKKSFFHAFEAAIKQLVELTNSEIHADVVDEHIDTAITVLRLALAHRQGKLTTEQKTKLQDLSTDVQYRLS